MHEAYEKFVDTRSITSGIKPSGWCKYVDSGWCYHPDLHLPDGCKGFKNCDYFKESK